MNPFSKKIPRGIIYHTVMQSLCYLIRALWMPLNDGSKVRDFERAFAFYCKRKHCVAFPFARTAIYYVLKNLDLPKGTEVILPPVTIKGIVDVVIDLGLIPRYVDLDPNTVCFSMDDLHNKVGPTTRAAIVTPLFGLVPDMDAMMKVFHEHDVFVIEDFSQCLNGGFNGKRIGTFGNVGIYSSSSIKTLDTLGGGLAVTNDDGLHKALCETQDRLKPPRRGGLIKKAWLNLVRNAATQQPWFSLLTFPILQLVRNRDPETALKQTGHRDKSRLISLPELWFCRFTSLQAAIGLENLRKVVSDDAARVDNVNFIKSHGGSEHFPVSHARSTNVYWQLIMQTPDAAKAQAFFSDRGVDVATSSLELISALQDFPNRESLLEAERIYRNGVLIPCYPDLSTVDKEWLAATVDEFFRGEGC